jgi:hypothetical protein
MKTSSGRTLLIGALLDRLGSAQAQALLAQLDKSLSQNELERYPRTTERRGECIGEGKRWQKSKETQP